MGQAAVRFSSSRVLVRSGEKDVDAKKARRYNEIFFMVDTCQANTLYSQFYSPNILAAGSSKKDQNSYSVRCLLGLALSGLSNLSIN